MHVHTYVCYVCKQSRSLYIVPSYTAIYYHYYYLLLLVGFGRIPYCRWSPFLVKATAFLFYQPRHQIQPLLSCILNVPLIKSNQVHVFVHILSAPELPPTIYSLRDSVAVWWDIPHLNLLFLASVKRRPSSPRSLEITLRRSGHAYLPLEYKLPYNALPPNWNRLFA